MADVGLFERAQGEIHPAQLALDTTAALIHALQPALTVRFRNDAAIVQRPLPPPSRIQHVNEEARRKRDEEDAQSRRNPMAHQSGANALTVDRFEGRYMLSGGADGSLAVWDLEMGTAVGDPDDDDDDGQGSKRLEYQPIGYASKLQTKHTHGITHTSWFPLDTDAFLTSSYDHTLKLHSTETLQPGASFDLNSVVYTHATSTIANHLLVACALQHPAVRLVDLRSGAATHMLSGHGGSAVLSVNWSPKDEHILASGASDGTVRFWDIRRSAASLAVLDMDDSIGLVGYDGKGLGARRRDRGQAHKGAVNGLVWTEDARYLVTTGHDSRIRVWDTHTGANTLASFGPVVRNRHIGTVNPLIAPRGMTRQGEDVMLFPNEREIVMFDLLDGRLMKKLRPVGVSQTAQVKVTCLAWRAHDVEVLSAHSDGAVRSWRPRTKVDAQLDEEDRVEDENDASVQSRKRKREVLEAVEKKPVTFI